MDHSINSVQDLGSSGSLTSVRSQGTASARRPSGPPPTQGRSLRQFRTAQSPYAATPPALAGSRRSQRQPRYEARELWIKALQLKGPRGTGLSTEGSRSVGPVRSVAQHSHLPGSGDYGFGERTRHAVAAVDGPAIPRRRALSASGSTSKSGITQASHKSREDLLDDVAELRKALAELTKEKNNLAGRLHSAEEEILRKDKRIADLLEGGRIEKIDAVRARTSSKNGANNVVATVQALKKKEHVLQCTLREKEKIIRQLKEDSKRTTAEELRIQVDTLCGEVLRLQDTADTQQQYIEQQKVELDSAIEAYQQRAEMEKQNILLKEQLQLTRNTQLVQTDKWNGYAEDKYADYNKRQMVRELASASKRIDELTKLVNELQQQKNMLTVEVDSLKQEVTHEEQFSSHVESLEERNEKLQGVIQRLKEDRTHYRQQAEETKQLSEQQSGELHRLAEEEASLRRTVAVLEQREDDERLARDHARQRLQRNCQPLAVGECRNAVQARAAARVQRQWRSFRAKKKQKLFEDDTNKALVEVQAAFRGHLQRKSQVLAAVSSDNSSDS